MARIEYRNVARKVVDSLGWKGCIAGGSGALLALATALTMQPAGELPHVSAPMPLLAEPDVHFDLSPEDPMDVVAPTEPVIYYQYLDEDGQVQFAKSLLEVPEEWRERAGRVAIPGIPPTTPAEARMVRKLHQARIDEGLDTE